MLFRVTLFLLFWTALAFAQAHKTMSNELYIFPSGLAGAIDDAGGAVFSVMAPQYAGGAKGDGATDDTAAIVAAAAACATSGIRAGTLYFPSGTYKTTASITITNCRVKGAGMVNTVIAPTTAVAGSPAIILAAPGNGGQIRQGGAEDIQITGPSAAPTLGLHPSSLVDCLRIDASMQLSRVRVTNCDVGFRENAPTGHISYFSAESTSNYYAVFKNRQGSAPGTDGGDSKYYDCNFSASYAVIGLANDAAIGGMQAIGGTWGIVPFGIWQEGSSNTPFMSTATFEDVHFEGIGNAMMASNNVASFGGANGGKIDNIFIHNPGYVVAPGQNLATASCVGAGNPVQCCRGAATGCENTYAVNVGVNDAQFYEWGGINPLAGATGALISTQNIGNIKLDLVSCGGGFATSCVTSPGTHPEFVQINAGRNAYNWLGMTPAATLVSCVVSSEGWIGFDSDVGEPCFCKPATHTWCKISAPATCGTATSCN